MNRASSFIFSTQLSLLFLKIPKFPPPIPHFRRLPLRAPLRRLVHAAVSTAPLLAPPRSAPRRSLRCCPPRASPLVAPPRAAAALRRCPSHAALLLAPPLPGAVSSAASARFLRRHRSSSSAATGPLPPLPASVGFLHRGKRVLGLESNLTLPIVFFLCFCFFLAGLFGSIIISQDVNRGVSRHKLLQDVGYEQGNSMVHGESGESLVRRS
ncbi:uncharacterized protein LOC131017971 isoform X3 [Salvia miltiorrhiza]|uniref:uncharacterized protein LOC131017971 isoform X3 n=1 Tax=Salvia miltiorrhiza TaxID=226208 RepID=UPI0025ABE6B5|nr:uncharacterized protein LOC131017971 isoform X3 [Salvia miltiorrhiza]XP_057802720.1 uncharacterized protein LOC131017971 isoform X3 [Salvia miltiorrhiza]